MPEMTNADVLIFTVVATLFFVYFGKFVFKLAIAIVFAYGVLILMTGGDVDLMQEASSIVEMLGEPANLEKIKEKISI